MASVLSNAEAYCKSMYGDYITLSSKEKQIVRNHTEYINHNVPYTKYKGITIALKSILVRFD